MYARRIEIKKLLMYTNEDAMIMLSLTNEHKGALYGRFYMHTEFLFSGIRNYILRNDFNLLYCVGLSYK